MFSEGIGIVWRKKSRWSLFKSPCTKKQLINILKNYNFLSKNYRLNHKRLFSKISTFGFNSFKYWKTVLRIISLITGTYQKVIEILDVLEKKFEISKRLKGLNIENPFLRMISLISESYQKFLRNIRNISKKIRIISLILLNYDQNFKSAICKKKIIL